MSLSASDHGGRWLVASSLAKKYFLYDLGSDSSKPRDLFDPGNTKDCLTSFTLWLDTAKENLCFRIATWKGSSPKERGQATRTRVYEVSILESEGSVSVSVKSVYETRGYFHGLQRLSIALSAENMVDAWVEDRMDIPKWTLRLCHYSRQNDYGPLADDAVVTVGAADDFSVKQVFITSEGQVAVVGIQCIVIYSISQLRESNKQVALPLHRINLICSSASIAAPFSSRGFDWMIVSQRDEFWLIRLARGASNPPKVVTLGRNPRSRGEGWFPGLVGRDAALAMYCYWTMKIITYSWDSETTQCKFNIKRVRIPDTARPARLINIGLDMIEGRLVFLDASKSSCIILDTITETL
ncbi:hypothetical protein D9756_009912 [Leucocoprinus leucothites]|uniref:Uncharacterized protein n=1 Tax=Leucocoprinus leucothites TaxID=201217 RepID=A0A8H5FSD2_9AGAR|nr:hypothetical protein D9756_009912 [Leucoagaricus leucothites]